MSQPHESAAGALSNEEVARCLIAPPGPAAFIRAVNEAARRLRLTPARNEPADRPKGGGEAMDAALGETIDQRDAAEDCIEKLLGLLGMRNGRDYEWSSAFGFAEAVELAEDALHETVQEAAQAAIKAAPPAPPATVGSEDGARLEEISPAAKKLAQALLVQFPQIREGIIWPKDVPEEAEAEKSYLVNHVAKFMQAFLAKDAIDAHHAARAKQPSPQGDRAAEGEAS